MVTSKQGERFRAAAAAAAAQQQQPNDALYCLVPRDLAPRVLEPLRRYFADEPTILVAVERRSADRRAATERRVSTDEWDRKERRAIRNLDGRRVGDRRASMVKIGRRQLPQKARGEAGRLMFRRRLEPHPQHVEDIDTARRVLRLQAGENDEFGVLYERYFDRVYSYLYLAVEDSHGAEDITQQVFLRVFEALPRYMRRAQPFRAWLFAVVRNHALDHLRIEGRSEAMDPEGLANELEPATISEADESFPAWITDADLMVFIDRISVAQRQALFLRFALDLPNEEVAAIMGRNPDDVRALQSRALRFLRARMTAVGRVPSVRQDEHMRRHEVTPPVVTARRGALLA